MYSFLFLKCAPLVLIFVLLLQVTTENIHFFTKQDFLDMYLPLGDYYLLMNKFGEKKSRSQELMKLVQCVRRDRNKTERAKPPTLQVSFKWFNFNKNKNKYSMVRGVENGGGVIQKVLNRSDDLHIVEKTAKDSFFPKGCNTKDELLSYFHWHIADHQLQKIKETVSDCDGNEKPFTIENFSSCKSQKRITFILMTKRMSPQQLVLSYSNKPLTSDSSDDDQSKHVKRARIDSRNVIESRNVSPQIVNNKESEDSSKKIATDNLKLDQDIEFLTGLREDQLKEKVCY